MRVVLSWKYLIVLMKWIQLSLRLTASGTIPKMLGWHQERTMSIPGPVETDKLQIAVTSGSFFFSSGSLSSPTDLRVLGANEPGSFEPSLRHRYSASSPPLHSDQQREGGKNKAHPVGLRTQTGRPRVRRPITNSLINGRNITLPSKSVSLYRSAQFSDLREGLLQQKLHIWSAHPLRGNTQNCTVHSSKDSACTKADTEHKQLLLPSVQRVPGDRTPLHPPLNSEFADIVRHLFKLNYTPIVRNCLWLLLFREWEPRAQTGWQGICCELTCPWADIQWVCLSSCFHLNSTARTDLWTKEALPVL